MTGKEALRELLEIMLYEVRRDDYNYAEEVSKVIEKELDKLTKYKRAFEILKNNCHISNYVVDGVNSGKKITFDVIREWYDKEEYELLEELMKSE